MNVFWSDRLEDLADRLFDNAASGDPFVPECVVVGSPVMAGWLKQHFLFERRRDQRVLANWSFVQLHPFINDWLARMGGQTGPRQAALHPYSLKCLQWRIYRLLESSAAPEFEVLRQYVGVDPNAAPRRRFGLAGQLARLFDDYQNYRARKLLDWEEGNTGELEPGLLWQPALWRALTEQDPGSYLALFRQMDTNIPAEAMAGEYRRISVFHVSSMPPPYLHFFDVLSRRNGIPIVLYAFNPSRGNWLGTPTPPEQGRYALEGRVDRTTVLDTPNPLLSGLGKGCQSFLAELLDRTGQQATGIDSPDTSRTGALLAQVQEQIRVCRPVPETGIAHPRKDPSIQFHICHGPMREVEVLRDQLLAWFEAHRSHQPRDVQVLVADLDTYAPYIDAVFQTDLRNAPATIPYAIADRPKPGAGPLGMAYLALLNCCDSRFTATELMGLLELDGIRDAFGLLPRQVGALRDLVIASGIRWGADAEHLRETLGAQMDAAATWRRGLDRMLLGYAMGQDEETCADRVLEAGDLGWLRSCDGIEGDAADLLGTLGRFFGSVHGLVRRFATPCAPAEWGSRLEDVLDTFFRSTNTTFEEIAEIRRAVRGVVETATAAGGNAGDEIPYPVAAAAVEESLAAPTPPANPAHNVVLFTPLQTMRPTPRPLLYLLGMGEGAFPRPDDRPTFDLMADPEDRRRGDRSRRLDDRLAFLEAFLCARERLVISYTGRDPKTNEVMPPSTVVAELQQYLDDVFQSTDNDPGVTSHYQWHETVHRLQAFHPDYFTTDDQPRSYSRSNYDAARSLVERRQRCPDTCPSERIAATDRTEHLALRLADLQGFFVNPAKIFYTHALQARLEDPEKGLLSDAEVFDPDALGKYQLNKLLLKHLLTVRDTPYPTALLREMGLIPLGIAGDIFAEKQTQELAGFLNASCNGVECSVHDLLVAHEAATPTVLPAFRYERMELTGSLRIVSLNGHRFLISARYSSVKPKDRIKAWIVHLYGHATGLTFTTLIVGGEKGKAMVEQIPTVSCEEARPALDALIVRYLDGCTRVLPFSPDTTYGYAATLRGENKGEADAQAAARNKWHNDRGYGENKDPYLYQKWGDDGPMRDPGFPTMARTVWDPFLNACGVNEAGEDAGEGGEE